MTTIDISVLDRRINDSPLSLLPVWYTASREDVDDDVTRMEPSLSVGAKASLSDPPGPAEPHQSTTLSS